MTFRCELEHQPVLFLALPLSLIHTHPIMSVSLDKPIQTCQKSDNTML